VLTVELDDTAGRLAAVQSALAQALVAGGFYEPETRPFLAHVTVARVQREARPRRGELPAPAPVRFTGETVTLFRSRLGKGPARYEALARVTLVS
jgi:2'-5' RNA ligase